MNYPRIYSLSTVGLLKHYVHDYLFHPLRTDFIGPNGVGKSIIADLLQLMFVYDTSLIKFGTDGVKKEDRRIYSLPHNVNTGYCFLNLEVEENKFLIIGIAISNQVSQRIVPFVIARSAEISKEFDQLYLTKKQLLTANSFIDEEKIPDIKTLATKLFNDKQLSLLPFRTKEEVKKYYQFLFDKQILSINLVVEENLKAFAKVIQSFSKAKSLDLSPNKASRSLKEFLFEESESEFQLEYHKQQSNLERLLRDFARLDAFIALLKQQLAALVPLKELETRRQTLYKEWKTAEIHAAQAQRTTLAGREQEFMMDIEGDRRLLQQVDASMARLPALNDRLNVAKVQATSNQDLYTQYKLHEEQLEELKRQINELKILQAMELSSDWALETTTIDMSLRTVSELKDLMALFQRYRTKYANFDELDKAYSKQQNEVTLQRIGLQEEKENLTNLIAILENKTSTSVLGWSIGNKQELTVEQRNILLYYATLSTQKKELPQKGERYANATELLQAETEQVKAASGFWVKLGAIQQFITYEKEADLLTETQNAKTIDAWLRKAKSDLLLVEQKVKELEEAAKGKPYNKELLPREYDLFLMHYPNVDRIKEAAHCAQQLGEKMKQLVNDQTAMRAAFQATKKLLPRNIRYQEAEMVKRELHIISERCFNRLRKFDIYKTKLEHRNTQLAEQIQGLRSNLTNITNTLFAQDAEIHGLRAAYFASFEENLEPLPADALPPDVNKLHNNYLQAHQEYVVAYRNAVDRFEETQNNLEVNAQVQSETYSFTVLEKALLGPTVRHTDDIATALTDANRSRMSMADELKASMVKIFDNTVMLYRRHKRLVNEVNTFFQGRKISDRFFFSVDFKPHENLKIEMVEDIGTRMRQAARQGELPFEQHVSVFIEEFFQKTARLKEKPSINQLLNPATYFDLSVSLTDDKGTEVPGSTGETYSAIALLGIARLSIVQADRRKGLRFIILEELGSLDSSNFNTFPVIAKEFAYQIITMAPSPFRTALSEEWYAHHLIKGIVDKDINYAPSASYFKTADRSQDLETYLSLKQNEMDRVEGVA